MSDPQTMRPRDDSSYRVDPGHGWVLFAGIALAVAGVLNIIYGIGAIGDSQFYVQDVKYVFANLHTWGWLMLIVGTIQAVAALGVFGETEWGRWLGILAALANMLVQFLALPSQPGLSVMLFMVDVIVVYGLLTFGGRSRYDLGG